MGERARTCSGAEGADRTQARTKKRNKKRNRKWSSDLDAVEIGPYLFVQLTCTKELREEGQKMEHCVRSYENLCRIDCTKIFSVRDALTQTRIATLSLIWENDYWRFDQMKGVRNTEVVCEELTYFDGERTVTETDFTDLHYAALELVQQYREAWLTQCPDDYLSNDR